jgi:hypothetical protein
MKRQIMKRQIMKRQHGRGTMLFLEGLLDHPRLAIESVMTEGRSFYLRFGCKDQAASFWFQSSNFNQDSFNQHFQSNDGITAIACSLSNRSLQPFNP